MSGMIYRDLGRTGVKVSVIGVGGSHIGKMADAGEAVRVIRAAMDAGINFMDNSWDYQQGESERRMGMALKEGGRDDAFLMTKFDARHKDAAMKQLDESLRRLRVDHVDLLQIHEVIRLEDPDVIFGEGGAAEALVEAQRAGKTRFIGFTGHKDPIVHIRMLDAAWKNGFRFDTVQMPLNVMDAHFRSFERGVLPMAVKKGVGVLAMKPFGNPHILESGTVTPVECLHYVMNLPVSTVITGIDGMEVLKQAIEAVRTFRPLGVVEVDSILERTREAAMSGRYELFKTSDVYDTTAHNPQWLKAA